MLYLFGNFADLIIKTGYSIVSRHRAVMMKGGKEARPKQIGVKPKSNTFVYPFQARGIRTAPESNCSPFNDTGVEKHSCKGGRCSVCQSTSWTSVLTNQERRCHWDENSMQFYNWNGNISKAMRFHTGRIPRSPLSWCIWKLLCYSEGGLAVSDLHRLV